jgi:hypothetical protein
VQTDFRESCARARFDLPDDAVLTGTTALRLGGIDVGPTTVRASTLTPCQTRRAGVRLSRVRALPDHVGGVARPLDAWRDARTELDLVELVAAGDALVRTGRVTRDLLTGAAEATSGRSCRLLRRAAALVRERVDSVQETRLRLCLVLAGLPEPRTNVVLGDDAGPLGRVDLLIEEYGLILEYDGDQHRDTGQWNLDLDRDDAFTSAAFTTIRVTRQRLRHARRLVLKVHARLVERGYAGPPPTFDVEWVALFERRV